MPGEKRGFDRNSSIWLFLFGRVESIAVGHNETADMQKEAEDLRGNWYEIMDIGGL